MNGQPYRNPPMQQKCRNRIDILSRRFEERKDHHPKNEYGDITEQYGERMAHGQIKQPFTGGSLPVLFARHDWKRTDVSAAQFAVVGVMIIVRAAPYRAWTNQKNAD